MLTCAFQFDNVIVLSIIGLYHASHSQFFQFFDFVGMYMFCMVPVVINCRRLGFFRKRRQNAVYTAGVTACTLLTPVLTALNVPIQLIVVLLVAFAGLTELKAFRKATATAKAAASATAGSLRASRARSNAAAAAAAVATAEKMPVGHGGSCSGGGSGSGDRTKGIRLHLGSSPPTSSTPSPPLPSVGGVFNPAASLMQAAGAGTAATTMTTTTPTAKATTNNIVTVATATTPAHYNWYCAGIGFLIVGLTCSMLDLNRIWCNPQNHVIQGHAVWHLFTALALICQFAHYAQFQKAPSLSTSFAVAAPKVHKAVKLHRRAISIDVERLAFQQQPSTTAGTSGHGNRDVVTSSGRSIGLIAHRRNKSYDALKYL